MREAVKWIKAKLLRTRRIICVWIYVFFISSRCSFLWISKKKILLHFRTHEQSIVAIVTTVNDCCDTCTSRMYVCAVRVCAWVCSTADSIIIIIIGVGVKSACVPSLCVESILRHWCTAILCCSLRQHEILHNGKHQTRCVEVCCSQHERRLCMCVCVCMRSPIASPIHPHSVRCLSSSSSALLLLLLFSNSAIRIGTAYDVRLWTSTLHSHQMHYSHARTHMCECLCLCRCRCRDFVSPNNNNNKK